MEDNNKKNVYVTVHKNFVRENIEYPDRKTGETKTFNSVTLPKGTVVNGQDVSYSQFSPLFVNPSRFKGENYRDIPLLTEKEVWLKKSVLEPDGSPTLDEDGKQVREVIKVMPAALKEGIDKGRAAYLASLDDKAKDALMSVLLLAMMLPFVAIMIPLFKMISGWGLVNSWAAFVLPSISTPFMIMLFRQAARSFPNDIIEAARLEGLSEIGIFFRMFIPIMRSTYGAAMTVTFMNAWNSYLWPKIVFQNNSSITMPMLVANLKSGYSVDYGMLMLGVLICTLPTAIIFLCLQKSFANGITGAVK